METYHVIVEQAEDGWLAAHALVDDSVHTQGKSLDEITANIRDVIETLFGERDVQIELLIPSSVRVA